MKFRASFQVPRETREDGGDNDKLSTPPKMSSLRHKKSRPWFGEAGGMAPGCDEAHNPLQQQDTQNSTAAPAPTTSKKQAMQDFLRSTSTRLKSTGANIKASASTSSKRLPHRFPVRKSGRAVQQPQPASKRNSQRRASKRASQVRSFDIQDEVLDKLMGPSKPPGLERIQSDHFFVKQRIRASSRHASSTKVGLSPTSATSPAANADKEPLTHQDVESMFVGAPWFNVEQEPGTKGRYKPQVIFRGGYVEESRRYGTDYASLQHSAFEASTLGLHRTRETAGRPMSMHGVEALADRPGDNLLEVPSMLSSNGLDPGTIGFEHFLQLPIADSAVMPDEALLFEKRLLLYSDPAKLGLRELDLRALIDRLTELDEVHNSQKEALGDPWSDERMEEMGEALFAWLLDSELGTTGAGTGDVALKTQIAGLQRVLAEKGLWKDFSEVEWRIRVGQLLWASADSEAARVDEQRQPSDRDVLLLQITLAAELLVRLDALKRLGGVLTADELEAIDSAQDRKLQWDVVVAKTFLENITVMAAKHEPHQQASNRASVFTAITYLTAKESAEETARSTAQPALFPKNEDLQLSGLLHFAQTLQWPHADDVRTQLEDRLTKPQHKAVADAIADGAEERSTWAARPVSGVSVYATPLSSPTFSKYTTGTANRCSYFGGLMGGSEQRARPGLTRITTANSMQLLAASAPSREPQSTSPDGFEVGGWLSRSWLAGLVLPGEPSAHFLISTLLENSPEAIDVLGDAANLYGGFVYRGRSFWSKSCVVGRVMAVRSGAAECMGWISVPQTASQDGRDAPDGWVDLDVKDVPVDEAAVGRIKDRGEVAQASDPLQGSSSGELRAGDFTTPLDGPIVMGNEVVSHGLSFKTSLTDDAAPDEPGPSGTNDTAQLTFSSPINAKTPRLTLSLAHDVHFVASYPCHPRPSRGASSKASSPIRANRAGPPAPTPASQREAAESVGEPIGSEGPPASAADGPEQLDHLAPAEAPADSARAGSTSTLSILDIEKALPPPPAHPLHIAYRYTILPVASLLTSPSAAPNSAPGGAGEEAITVLDCRGNEDLELLARAWCAQTGSHALVGKHGRTCLACCVREARGLGVGVVIRI
ncbi:hypothetical protein LTR53_003017 [Teratosphaeriaceae sp. CCFEE 6253]|nr:hypothetical protein LTR53_003017 [Teratosphaeriaceae sp. CCFEE 6253]